MDLAAFLDDLAHTPHLPGAKCRQNPALFDNTIPNVASRPVACQARREAVKICQACPALQACAAWLDTIPPPLRPHGVIADRTNTWLDPTDTPAARVNWWTGGPQRERQP